MFEAILGMLIYMLQMFLNVVYVWQSVCLLTFVPKVDRSISGSGRDILFWKFWRHAWYVGTLVPINSEFHCVSVSLVVGTLFYWNLTKLEISPALGEISFWIVMDTFCGCLYTCSREIQISNFNCKYFSMSWIQVVTSYHYCLSSGPPSETSGPVTYM